MSDEEELVPIYVTRDVKRQVDKLCKEDNRSASFVLNCLLSFVRR